MSSGWKTNASSADPMHVSKSRSFAGQLCSTYGDLAWKRAGLDFCAIFLQTSGPPHAAVVHLPLSRQHRSMWTQGVEPHIQKSHVHNLLSAVTHPILLSCSDNVSSFSSTLFPTVRKASVPPFLPSPMTRVMVLAAAPPAKIHNTPSFKNTSANYLPGGFVGM